MKNTTFVKIISESCTYIFTFFLVSTAFHVSIEKYIESLFVIIENGKDDFFVHPLGVFDSFLAYFPTYLIVLIFLSITLLFHFLIKENYINKKYDSVIQPILLTTVMISSSILLLSLLLFEKPLFLGKTLLRLQRVGGGIITEFTIKPAYLETLPKDVSNILKRDVHGDLTFEARIAFRNSSSGISYVYINDDDSKCYSIDQKTVHNVYNSLKTNY
jgi:hypothetical protein